MNMEHTPKNIAQNLSDLKLIFPSIMNNMKFIKFFTKKLENGK